MAENQTPFDDLIDLEDEIRSLREENTKLRLENDDLRQELAAVYESNRQLQVELLVQQNSVDSLLRKEEELLLEYAEYINISSAEVERLKWRLNHQTEDDAEACRQGKHTDCGKESK